MYFSHRSLARPLVLTRHLPSSRSNENIIHDTFVDVTRIRIILLLIESLTVNYAFTYINTNSYRFTYNKKYKLLYTNNPSAVQEGYHSDLFYNTFIAYTYIYFYSDTRTYVRLRFSVNDLLAFSKCPQHRQIWPFSKQTTITTSTHLVPVL